MSWAGIFAVAVVLAAACTAPPAPIPNPNPEVYLGCQFPRGSNTVKLTPVGNPGNDNGATNNRIFGSLAATDAWNASRAPRIERYASHWVGEIHIDVEAGYLGPNTVGRTTGFCANGAHLGPSRVALSSSPEYNFYPVSSWQAIAAHEYGHVLGIRDLYDPAYADSIMYWLHQLDVLEPTAADIFVMNGLYD